MRCKKIVYIAFLLLPLANFPFSKYGLGDDRSVSVILFAVFFLLNVDIIFKKCLYMQELKIYGVLFIAYIISLLCESGINEKKNVCIGIALTRHELE